MPGSSLPLPRQGRRPRQGAGGGRVRRAVFGGTDDKPLQHLGEAETCVVIKEWAEFAGS